MASAGVAGATSTRGSSPRAPPTSAARAAVRSGNTRTFPSATHVPLGHAEPAQQAAGVRSGRRVPEPTQWLAAPVARWPARLRARQELIGRPRTGPAPAASGHRVPRTTTVGAHRSGHREVGRVSITASRSPHVTSR
ncbi:hypothetical protein TNCT1_44400 [Streptomyces sp. 1-11]|nr:hypothetical protein TNCT1_44400 [Streptomyces sp. 1-11]